MTGDLTFDHNGQHVEGYLSEPEGTPRAGVVVIQEWWGLNDDIKGIADRFAAEGYLAFAPDLYDGVVSTEPDEALKLAMALERDIARPGSRRGTELAEGRARASRRRVVSGSAWVGV